MASGFGKLFDPNEHPRGWHGRFVNKWKVSSWLQKIFDSFSPRTFSTRQQAGQYATNQSRKRVMDVADRRRIHLDFDEATDHLRSDDIDDSTKKFMQVMDRHMFPTDEDLIGNRTFTPEALGLTAADLHENPGGITDFMGDTLSDKAYSAWHIGDYLDNPRGPQPGPGKITMSIAVPKGTRAVWPGDGKGVFFDRNQRLTITNIAPDGKGGWYMMAVAEPREAETSGVPKDVVTGRRGAGLDVAAREARLKGGLPKAAPEPVSQAPAEVVAQVPGVAPAPHVARSAAQQEARVARVKAGRQARVNEGNEPIQAPLPSPEPIPGPAPAKAAKSSVPDRNEPVHVESIGGAPAHGRSASEIAETPATPEPQLEAPTGEVPRSGPEVGADFKKAYQDSDIVSPSKGPHRAAFNKAYQDAVSGKEPVRALRDLERDIEHAKGLQKRGEGNSDTPGDIDSMEQLADLIARNHNLERRGASSAAPSPIKREEGPDKFLDEGAGKAGVRPAKQVSGQASKTTTGLTRAEQTGTGKGTAGVGGAGPAEAPRVRGPQGERNAAAAARRAETGELKPTLTAAKVAPGDVLQIRKGEDGKWYNSRTKTGSTPFEVTSVERVGNTRVFHGKDADGNDITVEALGRNAVNRHIEKPRKIATPEEKATEGLRHPERAERAARRATEPKRAPTPGIAEKAALADERVRAKQDKPFTRKQLESMPDVVREQVLKDGGVHADQLRKLDAEKAAKAAPAKAVKKAAKAAPAVAPEAAAAKAETARLKKAAEEAGLPYNVQALRARAKTEKIKGFGTMKRDDLIRSLLGEEVERKVAGKIGLVPPAKLVPHLEAAKSDQAIQGLLEGHTLADLHDVAEHMGLEGHKSIKTKPKLTRAIVRHLRPEGPGQGHIPDKSLDEETAGIKISEAASAILKDVDPDSAASLRSHRDQLDELAKQQQADGDLANAGRSHKLSDILGMRAQEISGEEEEPVAAKKAVAKATELKDPPSVRDRKRLKEAGPDSERIRARAQELITGEEKTPAVAWKQALDEHAQVGGGRTMGLGDQLKSDLLKTAADEKVPGIKSSMTKGQLREAIEKHRKGVTEGRISEDRPAVVERPRHVPESPQKVLARIKATSAEDRLANAQNRQTELDRVRGVSEIARDVAQVRANGGSNIAQKHRLRVAADRIQADPEIHDQLLKAIDSGNPGDLDTALRRIETEHGLSRIGGDPGTTGTFDRKTMAPIGKAIPDGTPVHIVRSGYEYDRPGEGKVRLSKAVVQAMTPADLEAHDRVPEASVPGQRTTVPIDNPVRRSSFQEGWKTRGIKELDSPEGRSIKEIHDDVDSGAITPEEGIRRMETEIEESRNELGEVRRELRNTELTPGERQHLGKRNTELVEAIGEQEKASKFMRGHFGKEEITAKEVKQIPMPQELSDTIRRATPEQIKQEARDAGLGELQGGDDKEALATDMLRKIIQREMDGKTPTAPKKVRVTRADLDAPKPEFQEGGSKHLNARSIAEGLDLDDDALKAIQGDLDSGTSPRDVSKRLRTVAEAKRASAVLSFGDWADDKVGGTNLSPEQIAERRGHHDRLVDEGRRLDEMADRLASTRRPTIRQHKEPAVEKLTERIIDRASKGFEDAADRESAVKAGEAMRADMTLPELRRYAAPHGINGRSKQDIIDKLVDRRFPGEEKAPHGSIMGEAIRDSKLTPLHTRNVGAPTAVAGNADNQAIRDAPNLGEAARIADGLKGSALDKALADAGLSPEGTTSIEERRLLVAHLRGKSMPAPVVKKVRKATAGPKAEPRLSPDAEKVRLEAERAENAARLKVAKEMPAPAKVAKAAAPEAPSAPRTSMDDRRSSGTAKGKITAGRLLPGDRVIVQKSGHPDGGWMATTGKTGTPVTLVSRDRNGFDAVTDDGEKVRVAGHGRALVSHQSFWQAPEGAPATKKAAKAVKAAAPSVPAKATPAPAQASDGPVKGLQHLNMGGGSSFEEMRANNEKLVQRLGRDTGDTKLRLPNGGQDQGRMHLDSKVGQLWQDLAVDKRTSNTDLNEITRIGEEIGTGKISLDQAAQELGALKRKAPDSAVASHIQDVIDAITGGATPKLNLPEGLPSGVREFVEAMAATPTMRKSTIPGMFHNKESALDRVLKLIHDADTDPETHGGMDFLSQLYAAVPHESVDGAYPLQRMGTKLQVDGPTQMAVRKWLRERRPSVPKVNGGVANPRAQVPGQGSHSPAAPVVRMPTRGASHVRPQLRETRDRLDVEIVLAHELARITGDRPNRDAVSLFGMDHDMAQEAAEGILRGQERFPHVRLLQVSTFGSDGAYRPHLGQHPPGLPPGNPAAYALTTRHGEGAIFINMDEMGNQAHLDEYTRVSQDVAPLGMRPFVAGTAVGILSHEFGHLLIRSDDDAVMHATWDDFAKWVKKKYPGQDPLEAVMRGVSAYAGTKWAEAMAEAFADVMIHGADAHEMSRMIYELVAKFGTLHQGKVKS